MCLHLIIRLLSFFVSSLLSSPDLTSFPLILLNMSVWLFPCRYGSTLFSDHHTIHTVCFKYIFVSMSHSSALVLYLEPYVNCSKYRWHQCCSTGVRQNGSETLTYLTQQPLFFLPEHDLHLTDLLAESLHVFISSLLRYYRTSSLLALTEVFCTKKGKRKKQLFCRLFLH